MSAANPLTATDEIVYPDSDGMPMADNTLQFRWIVTIEGGFEALYRDDPNVFVAGDLLWYPVEGDPRKRLAPDALIAFGRPKGYRGSYMQWREEGIAPQVVFEVLSPGNTRSEMERKLLFYMRYGVEEYYVYDPDNGDLRGYIRANEWLEPIDTIEGWVSPRTGVRFGLEGLDLVLTRPDGQRFKGYVELEQEREEAVAARAEAVAAQAHAEAARDEATARAERLAVRLRAAGIDPDE
jgi:Uma2 family endonuclease